MSAIPTSMHTPAHAAATAHSYYRFKPYNIGRWIVWGLFALLLLVAPLVFTSSLSQTMLSQMGIAIIVCLFTGVRQIAWRDWGRIAIAALAGNLGYQILAAFGMQSVPASWTGLLFGLEPVFIALFAVVFAADVAFVVVFAAAFFAVAIFCLLEGSGPDEP